MRTLSEEWASSQIGQTLMYGRPIIAKTCASWIFEGLTVLTSLVFLPEFLGVSNKKSLRPLNEFSNVEPLALDFLAKMFVEVPNMVEIDWKSTGN